MRSARIKVGDQVRFRLAKTAIVGRVKEDRGPIGLGGRHLYGITYELGKGYWYYTELPADDLEVIGPKKEPA
jgi:hypothetical protein